MYSEEEVLSAQSMFYFKPPGARGQALHQDNFYLRVEPGDVLFFNGSLVHGSGPDTTTGRFRRSFICHYVGRSAQRIAEYYPVMTMRGERVQLAASVGGGPCGTDAGLTGPH